MAWFMTSTICGKFRLKAISQLRSNMVQTVDNSVGDASMTGKWPILCAFGMLSLWHKVLKLVHPGRGGRKVFARKILQRWKAVSRALGVVGGLCILPSGSSCARTMVLSGSCAVFWYVLFNVILLSGKLFSFHQNHYCPISLL